MFHNLPLPVAQEVRDSNSSMNPCIFMQNDGILYHQLLSFSLERWLKMVLQECAIVGSVYHLSLEVQHGAVLPHQCLMPQ